MLVRTVSGSGGLACRAATTAAVHGSAAGAALKGSLLPYSATPPATAIMDQCSNLLKGIGAVLRVYMYA
jgi:hypothetical protein